MAQATTTFLQLCQKTARESGVISGTRPTTTVGQTGQLLQLVSWVKDAWTYVQTRERWPWLRSDWSGQTVIGTTSYTPTDWSLTDHADWIFLPENTTLYLTATGVSDEAPIKAISYDTFRRMYLVGSQTANRPINYSVSPTGAFLLGPKPDAVYTVRGEYWKVPQIFSADADVPTGLPEEYTDIIVYRALQAFGEYDEAAGAITAANRNYIEMLARMQRTLLPKISLGGSIL